MYTLYYIPKHRTFIFHNNWLEKTTAFYCNPYKCITSIPYKTDVLNRFFTVPIETKSSPSEFYYTDIFKIKRDFPELFI